ncbi:MAG: hypothetical protein JNL90_18430 [Planctomycetes bacterium]|nr:hypothetical protein [Planctomycetota bacterium]
MRNRANAGSTLIVALASTMLAAGIACAGLSIATTGQADTAREELKLRAKAVADAGVHRAIAFLDQTARLSPFEPFATLDDLLFDGGGAAIDYLLAEDEPLVMGGTTYGTCSVLLTASASGLVRDVTVTATGYVPNRASAKFRRTMQAVVRVEQRPAEVFDYSYFINNWGWFYGNTINGYGNVRSNGQFDAANYAPGAFGTPRYERIDLANPAAPDLVGYQDDNGDGVLDGSDGGIFAGWDIKDAGNVRGLGGEAQNQHDFVAQTAMPNLNDLSVYEARALAAGASLAIGGAGGLPATPVADAVLGDGVGEKQNLVLIGTVDQPILLDGPVVVRGDVIIAGVVSGQGAIYAGGNVYIANDLTYLDPPATSLPATNSEADTEAWIAANRSKDFLGLFAREHVVFGDYTHWIWRYYVDWWTNDAMNASAEDAGEDQIPGTRAGRDGIMDTADDDVLEGDGCFTVSHYTEAHAALGQIPAGKSVGDVIPGSGEDIDGDGAYDGTTTLAEFDLAAALDSGEWAGNLPAGTLHYSEIATLELTDVQAAVYTNHAAAMVTLAWGEDFDLLGALVSRNESMIYGTNHLNLTHDRRLTAGGAYGTLLPSEIVPARILAWRSLEQDLHYLGAAP